MAELKFKGESVIGTTVTEDGRLFVGVKGFPEMFVDMARLSEEQKKMALINGMRQRLMDAAALKFNKEENRFPTPEEKHAAMRRLFDHYMGDATAWELERSASGPRGPQWDWVLVDAVGEAFGKTREVVVGMIEEKAKEKGLKPKDYLAKMGELAVVAPIVKRMRDAALASIEVDENPFGE